MALSGLNHAIAADRSGDAYNAGQLAQKLGVSRIMIYRAAAAGQIPCLRFGKRFVFPKPAIDRWLTNVEAPIQAA